MTAEPILATHDLTKWYGPALVVDAVNLAVPEGGVFGLVGPNGAGKTTLLSIVTGLRRQTGGSVELRAARSDLAVCPDAPEFEPWLTASEVVALAASLGGRHASPSAVRSVLDQAGLGSAAHRRVGGFSRGMTQRLALAATVITEPRVIVLDEPCAALDPAGRVEVLDLITSLAERCSVIFSSHILGDVERVCDTVGVLRNGQLLYQGALDLLLSEHIRPAWIVTVRPPFDAAAIGRARWVRGVDDLGDGRFRVTATSVDDGEGSLAGALARVKARVVSIEPEAADLEAVFLGMTGEAE